MTKRFSFLRNHNARSGRSLIVLLFLSSLMGLISCNAKTSTSAAAGVSSDATGTSAGDALGTWHDEDQLLLVGATEEVQDVVVGYDLVPKDVVREREAQGQKIYGWMMLRNKRIISNTSYSLELTCLTHEGEEASLKVSSAVTFAAGKSSFKTTEDEKSIYRKLGEFDCYASLPGFTSRKFKLSADKQYLSLFEENSSVELIVLKRGQ